MSQKIQVRRGTDTQRQTKTFDSGELVYTTDTKQLYVGDGETSGGISVMASVFSLINNILSGVTSFTKAIIDSITIDGNQIKASSTNGTLLIDTREVGTGAIEIQSGSNIILDIGTGSYIPIHCNDVEVACIGFNGFASFKDYDCYGTDGYKCASTIVINRNREAFLTKATIDNITVDGNEITSDTGIISLGSNTLRTEGSMKTNILELGNCVNYALNGYLGDTSGNKWFEVATITLNNQYEGCSLKGYIATGASVIDSLKFELKVKQDDPLGQSPVISLKFAKHTSNANLKAIIAQNDATATVVKIYAYCVNDYSTIFYRLLADSFKCASTTTVIEGLATGTEIEPTSYFSELSINSLLINQTVRIKTDGSYVHKANTTANRPASPTIGQEYFDTTLSMPIWWNGSNWKDAAGNTV
jgi:hypothetical protein